ncbi:erythrocyte membrane protein 1, PfEMP1, putative [Plasmodium reichenowi]|uniref:Erythrocyte membrane protein 1, PfEMP1, putative n=1 Tax=Plasmodium reichenowi TaxID=5854 RepID=A0A2P9DSF1_PLARE|nr:erythrocyte membrane protein 1, PfEMP1, putative [Plasmodium reichenowi]
MGGNVSTNVSKSFVGKETHNSTRNVLENISQDIKKQAEKDAKSHRKFLKGKLENASFSGAYAEWLRVYRYDSTDPCSLHHMRHTNLLNSSVDERNPCDGRNQNRFDEGQESECSRGIIKGNENKSDGGSCAPPRRRHICDKNLEAINVHNTTNSDDLLGNILVTAKYEGASIVQKHPNRGSSEVCTALARSFADIGDIIRGRDMFLGNNKEKENIQNNLQKIFQNIKTKDPKLQSLKDEEIREYWWALNRQDVWKALTCSADDIEEYFIQSEDKTQSFSNPKCGHKNDGAPPTHLDYVPQFLRWFNEWSEDFCRVREHKLKNVKEACRGDNNDRHCDGNGYDCKRTDLKKNEIFMDLKCPNCADACTSYKQWLQKKEGEFNKQKNKYDKEIENKQSNSHSTYDKKFYNNLKREYPSVKQFVETLKEGAYCTNGTIEGKIDFIKQYDTFSRSEFCKPCPILDDKCKGKQCKSINDIKCTYVKKIPKRETDKNNDAFVIDILLNNSKKRKLSNDLKDDLNQCNLFKRLRKQNWNCEYKCNLHVCEQKNYNKEIDDEQFISIKVFIQRWLESFLKDYNQIKEKLKQCINKEKKELQCIKDCYKNCDCVEKWIKKKGEEWQNIKGYLKPYEVENEDIADDLKKFLKQHLFKNYIENALEKGEKLDNMKESDGCDGPSKSRGKPCEKKDVITILLHRLQKQMDECKTQHNEKIDSNSCDTTTKIISADDDDDDDDEESSPDGGDHKESGVCNTVETLIRTNDGTKDVSGCKRKENYQPWNCDETGTVINHKEKGACMPPRRQSLCIHDLKELKKKPDTNKKDLKEAFIKCAAAETFFSWQKYKTDNKDDKNLQTQLESGEIPKDFKRQMFYTFGDFRDLCIGNDLGNHADTKDISGTVTSILKNESNGQILDESDKDKRKNWWETIEKEVWNGMLCALSYDTTQNNVKQETRKNLSEKNDYSNVKFSGEKSPILDEFAKKPQFLRWMTEWGEHFCRERKKKEKEVENKCKNDYEGCNKEKKNGNTCFNACEAYKKYITDKEKEYTTQKTKFNSERTNGNGEYKNYRDKESHDYLKEKCFNGTCNCIEKVKDSSNYWEKPFENFEKDALKNKCECQEAPPAKVPEVPKEIVPEKKVPVPARKKQSEAPTPCTIVDDILGDKSSSGYAEGCKTKYGTMTRNEWLCNNSGGKGKEEGDVVCIPPRRKRLYVKNLQDFTGNSQEELRKAFIESAAVETFFQWHEYKKEKQKEEKEKQDGLVGATTSDKEQEQLKSGEIPEEFLRQMFYTLGDYRDILFGKDIGGGKDMKTVEEKINKVFTNSGKPSSGLTREKWWNDYEKDIWEGMLCGLSYNTETKEKDRKVKTELFDTDGSKLKNKYNYESVSFHGGFDESSDTGPRQTGDPPRTQTTLSKFVKRPTFFRWLEEWGDEFCRKQTHKLDIIESECRGGEKVCSGYGEDCTETVTNGQRTVPDLKCRSCANSCRFYKKWIERKRTEFNKQKGQYENEIRNNKSDNNSNGFYKNLKTTCPKAEDFLEKLDGPCSSSNNGVITISFNNAKETFKHTEKCDPCSEFKVKCNGNGNCGSDTKVKCNDINRIGAKEIEQMKSSTDDVDMHVSDNNKNVFSNGLIVCKDKDIFEGIKENKWSCVNFCGLDVCGLKKNNNNGIDEKHIMQIRAFLKLWVEFFLEDYSKIKHKISHCIHNGPNKCKCKDKCTCVDEWLKKKKEEWEQIRKRFFDQYNLDKSDVYELNSFISGNVYSIDITNALNKDETLEELKESGRCSNSGNKQEQKCKKQDVIEILIDRLQNEINDYQTKHKESGNNNCPSSSPTPTNDNDHNTDIPLESFPPPYCNVPSNPCSGETATNVVSVKEVAGEMQQQTHAEMLKRSGKDGEDKSRDSGEKVSVLKANAAEGQYERKGEPNKLTDVCSITDQHTNDTRGTNGGPCAGKGNGLDIVHIGRDGISESSTPGVYIRPRRLHMCTSNVEYSLHSTYGKLLNVENGKINHSFLGDVLLAAKKEAEKIKELYKPTSDKEGICRAIRYSFADIADIIRGTDLWDKNVEEVKTQKNFVTLFGKIKDYISDSDIKSKYTDPKHLDLRKDWWEANRDKIWQAMQCPPSRGTTINCDKEPTPIDDHIPQRLRWMTEWAEWYCKMQKKEYDDLVRKCRGCRSKGKNCMNGEQKCTECTTACTAYNTKIKEWEDQWKKIKEKYDKLYDKAKAQNGAATTSGTGSSKDEKYVVAFLSKLRNQNSGNNIYSTAEGYIHQEAHISECQKQTLFCKKENGETTSSGGTSSTDKDKEYAFRPKPYDYEKACDCEKNKKPQVLPRPKTHLTEYWSDIWRKSTTPRMLGKWKRKKIITTCDIVEDIIKKSNDGKKPIDGCHSKNEDKNYPKWECEKYIDKSHTGACIPPRRQKICLHYLEKPMINTNVLKYAFIKCAAAETFLLWQKYKEDKTKEPNGETTTKLDNKLKDGEIPEEFKRQMFYTFADYRDLCLDTDLSSKTDTKSAVGIAKNNIYEVFKKNYQTTIDHRRNWWENHGPEIWKGMICALSYDTETKEKIPDVYNKLTHAKNNNTYNNVKFSGENSPTLEKFASRPQFLRWFTEWGEHFCREHKKELDKLVGGCKECTVGKSGTRDGIKTCDDKENCDVCKKQCKKYQDWLEKWKEHYNNQKQRYTQVKETPPYKNDTDVKDSPDVREYLDKQLKNMVCTNGTTSVKCEYNCMNEKSSTNSEMPESLDEKPKEVKDKCNCVRDECTGLSVTGSGFPDAGVFGGGLPSGSCKGFEEHVPKKIEPPQYDPTNDILKNTIPIGIALALGSIAFLYLKKKPKSPVDLLHVLNIHKGEYGMPTKLSSNRYIPYKSAQYRGKRYIYMEGDSSGDEKYAFMSDTTDVTSSESEYEELDINDIYPYQSPKYKTLIEVVLEPSKRDTFNTPSADTHRNKPINDEEWNTLKDDFISNMLQNVQNDVPNNYRSAHIPMNAQPNTLYFHKPEEKPFITSIHDRNLYTGEEYNYDINMSTNTTNDPKYVSNNVYSRIDLINDSLSGDHDIYDEVLKRKENELFGTKHPKNITFNSVAKPTNTDPVMNQLDLFYKWLDRHRDMCEQWNNKEELLDKLKEKWDNDNNSGDTTPSNNKMVNTDVSIEIDMDNPKPINIVDINPDNSSMDNMEDDIYYDVNDDDNNQPSVDDIPMDHNKVDVDVPKKVHVEMKILNNISKSSLEQQFPISDVWNI